MKIKVENLSFCYQKDKNILDNVSFAISKGEICCILGKNGSGKTTLIKCINRLLIPYSGEVFIDGRNTKKMSNKDIAKSMAFIPQEHRISFNYSVIDMVVMGRFPNLTMFSHPSDKDYEIALSSLTEIGIENLAFRNYNELSGGEKQLVLISRALAQQPEIFLLDEPTSHLDFKNQHFILQTITKIALKNNVSIIMAMHDPNLAIKFCNRFITLKDGKVLVSGTSNDILNEENLSNIYDMKINIKYLDSGSTFITPES